MRFYETLTKALRAGLPIALLSTSLTGHAVTDAAKAGSAGGAASASSSAVASMEGAPVSCTSYPNAPARRLTGTVADRTGARIPSAVLTLSCGDFSTKVTADASGAYSFSVPAGNYRLQVEATNFGTVSQDVVIGDTASATEVNPVLQLGQLSSNITVSAGNQYATTETLVGTKSELPLSETPQAITVINRQLMDAQNVVKLDDALKNVAGVIPGGYYDGWDYYRIRGFDASFNTYIDGLRGGNGMMEETWGLESVEVLKGPSSALYGQSVLGGLVNITTRKPVPDRFVHAQFTGGSFAFMDPAIDIGGSLNSSRTVYGRLAALYHTSNSYVDYAYRHRYYFAPSLTWKPAPGTSLTLIGRIQRDNGRNGMPLPALGTALPNINGPLSIHTYNGELGANANKLSQANQQFGFQFRQQINEFVTLRSNGRFAWYQQHWNRIYYPGFLGADQRTLYRYPYTYDGPWQAHEVDTSLEGKGKLLGLDHTAILGLDFYRSPSTGTGYSIDFNDLSQYEPLDLYKPVYGQNAYNPLIPASDSHTVTQYAGLYFQDHIRLPWHVTATGGARADFAKNENRGMPNQNNIGLTPRLGLTWQVIPSTTIYASFSKSFLPQSGTSFVQGSLIGSYIPPERGKQWEGGAKSAFWGGRVMTTVALFQLDRGNVAISDQQHPGFSIVTGTQRSRGVEFEATLHPLAGWNVTSAYSYINAVVTNGDVSAAPTGARTLNAPKNIFNVWSTYEVPRGFARGFGVGFGGRHYTDQAGDLANSFFLPGYGVLDGSMSYRRWHSLWQVNANNIANKRYWAGSYNDLYVKPGIPREVRGTISWNF